MSRSKAKTAAAPAAQDAPVDAVTEVAKKLPADLAALIAETAEALKVVAAGVTALETAPDADKTDIGAKLAAATDEAEAAHAAIDAWVANYASEKLAAADEQFASELKSRGTEHALKLKAADDEAERQLADKRDEVARKLQEHEDTLQHDLEASNSRHTTQSEEGSGGDDPVTPTIAGGFVLVVVAKAESRWRAGRQFTKEPTRIPGELISATELTSLESDPLLVCTVEPAPEL